MFSNNNKLSLLFAGALFAGSTLLVGCSDDDDNGNGGMDGGAPGTAMLRVVHASPDAPAVDIYAAGSDTPLVTDLAYGDATTYLSVDEGTYDLEIRGAGAAADSAPVFSTGDVTLYDGDVVTAVAAGLLASSDSTDGFRVLLLAEAFDAPAAGNAIVRIVHASSDAPTVAVDVGNDGTPEVDSLARFADTGSAGVELPAGEAIAVGIWAGSPLARVTAFTTPELPDGAELFVIATGLVDSLPRNDDGFSLLAIGPSGAIGFIKQDPTVHALHGSPDAPAVDIYAGSTLLVENAAFGDLSGTIQVPPGSYDLDFYATGTGPGTPVATLSTPELAAGERYLAIANGFLSAETGEEEFTLIPVVEALDDTDLDNARVAVVHGSPDAPAVDVGTVDGDMIDTVLASDVAFAETAAADGLSLAPGTVTVGVAAAGTTDVVASFDIPVSAGLRAFAVASGALSPAGDEASFRLLVVVTSDWPWQVLEVLPN